MIVAGGDHELVKPTSCDCNLLRPTLMYHLLLWGLGVHTFLLPPGLLPDGNSAPGELPGGTAPPDCTFLRQEGPSHETCC